MERDMKNLLFIEAGEYMKHLYGTRIDAVRRVMESVRGKKTLRSHPLLRSIAEQTLRFGCRRFCSETFVERRYRSNCDLYQSA